MGTEACAFLWYGLAWSGELDWTGFPPSAAAFLREEDMFGEVDDFVKPFGAELVRYGYEHDFERVGLAAKESVTRVSAGSHITFGANPDYFVTGLLPVWDKIIVKAAEAIHWPIAAPQWYVGGRLNW